MIKEIKDKINIDFLCNIIEEYSNGNCIYNKENNYYIFYYTSYLAIKYNKGRKAEYNIDGLIDRLKYLKTLNVINDYGFLGKNIEKGELENMVGINADKNGIIWNNIIKLGLENELNEIIEEGYEKYIFTFKKRKEKLEINNMLREGIGSNLIKKISLGHYYISYDKTKLMLFYNILYGNRYTYDVPKQFLDIIIKKYNNILNSKEYKSLSFEINTIKSLLKIKESTIYDIEVLIKIFLIKDINNIKILYTELMKILNNSDIKDINLIIGIYSKELKKIDISALSQNESNDNSDYIKLSNNIIYNKKTYIFTNTINNESYSIYNHGDYDIFIDTLLKHKSIFVNHNIFIKNNDMKVLKKNSDTRNKEKRITDVKNNLMNIIFKRLLLKEEQRKSFNTLIQSNNGFRITYE